MGHVSLVSILTVLVVTGACVADEPGGPAAAADAASHDTGLVRHWDAGLTTLDASRLDAAGGGTRGDATVAPEAGPPIVTPPAVGLNPASDPTRYGASELQLADLEVLAIGSRALSLSRDQLIDSSGRLTARARSLSQGSVQLLVSVPLEVNEADSTSMDEWTAFVDQLFEQSFALSYLVIGESLDVRLAGASEQQHERALQWVEEAVDYVRQHPQRPPSLRLGVSASLAGWSESRSLMRQLAKLVDVASARWFVANEAGRALKPDEALEQLQDALEAARQLNRPLILEQVSYPRSQAWESSDRAQASFYERLFEYLGARQEQLRFVAVTALDELPSEVCADYSLQYVRANLIPCDIGLRDEQRRPRPAFEPVIEALARFSSSGSSTR